jgi:DNA-binding LytR/AlgR family response regulator
MVKSNGDRSPSADQPVADRIIIKDRNRMRLLRAYEVDWVESEGNYVRLHVGSSSHLVRGNLSRLEESLEPFGFIRVHRRFLVNLDRVIEVQPWFGGRCGARPEFWSESAVVAHVQDSVRRDDFLLFNTQVRR